MTLGAFKTGGWVLLGGWIFPSFIFVSLLVSVALPRFKSQHYIAEILNLPFAERAVAVTAAAAAIGIILNACSRTLYRILEGYILMPLWLNNRLVVRQNRKREQLRKDYEKAAETPGKSIRAGLLMEKYNSYPVPSMDVAPTTFANVLHAAERYGWDRYQLDSVTYWSGLLAHCPEPLRTSEERSRTGVDFFVASCYLSALFSVTAIAMLLIDGLMPGLVILSVSIITVIGSYSLAVSAARNWGEDIKSVVDVGRVEMLRSLGLEKPESLSDERNQWRALGWLRNYPFADAEKSLKGTALWPEANDEQVGKRDSLNVDDGHKLKRSWWPKIVACFYWHGR